MKHVKRKTPIIPRWKRNLFWLLSGLFVILGSVQAYLIVVPHKTVTKAVTTTSTEQQEALRFSIYDVLLNYDIRMDWISGDSRDKKVRIPADLPMVVPYVALLDKFKQLGGNVLKAKSNPDGTDMKVEIGYGGKSVVRVHLVKDPELHRSAGKIAIVIDDFGYALSSDIREFIDLPQTITLSVLPGLTYSKKIAALAHENGREVLLHLPMQPENGNYKKDDYILLTKMEANEIRKRVRRSLNAVPFARGANNHKGSLATTDKKMMGVVMDELKKHQYFFLDSRTSKKSIAYDIAKKKKLSCGYNNAFLDSIQEEPFVRQQLNTLAEMAVKKGYAIGIGHPHEVTLSVLKEELPKFEQRGFQFVTISEIMKEENKK